MSMWQRRFGIQLAYPMEIGRLLKIPTPWVVQPKLNGERCRALIDRRGVTLLSSEENEIVVLPHISEALYRLDLGDLELDGEIYLHGLTKQQISSYLRRKTPHPEHKSIQYHIFDLICALPQVNRIDYLIHCLRRRICNPCLQIVPTHSVDSFEELASIYQYYVGHHYEGLIIRHPHAHYERKRTTSMLKWKPKHYDSYLIVNLIEEVSLSGVGKQRVGAFLCRKDSQEFNISAGGLTYSLKKFYWDNPKEAIGKYLLVRYAELSDSGIPQHAVVLELTDSEVLDNDN